MTAPVRVEWAEGPSAPPTIKFELAQSPEELDSILDRLDRMARMQDPIVAELIHPSGASLGIGLGLEFCVLAFKAHPTEPPYYVSAGGGKRGWQDDVGFYYQGEWTEFGSEQLVDHDTARAAAHSFFCSGTLPAGATWEEV